jgi:N-acetylneuraminic acid mutarotase
LKIELVAVRIREFQDAGNSSVGDISFFSYIGISKTARMLLRLFSIALVLCFILSCTKHGPSGSPGKATINDTPEISNFEPMIGAPGIPVEIWGHHFNDTATNLLVEFNGAPATIYSTNDSVMYVFVPPGVTTGKISVTCAGLTGASDSLFRALPGGHWVEKSGIPGADSANGRFVGIGFSVGGKGYMGLGDGNYGSFYSDLYQYDPATDSWAQEASAPVALAAAVSMVINNIAYIGLGGTTVSTNSNAFYAYDPAANTWIRKADYPGSGQLLAAAVAIDSIGLVAFGNNISGNEFPEVWIYHPLTDTWTQKANFPGTLPSWPVGFSLDNKTAFIEGTDYYTGVFVNVLYQYDPIADAWTQKQSRPGAVMAQACAMVIGGNGYIMGGGEESWMYQPGSDSWTQVPFFTQRNGAASFVIGGTGYFGNGGNIAQTALTDLWQFTP